MGVHVTLAAMCLDFKQLQNYKPNSFDFNIGNWENQSSLVLEQYWPYNSFDEYNQKKKKFYPQNLGWKFSIMVEKFLRNMNAWWATRVIFKYK